MNEKQYRLFKALVPLFWLFLVAGILGLLNPMKWPGIARIHSGFLAVVAILMLIFFVALAMTTDLVRDTSPQPSSGKRPYSLSRVQAAFWLYVVSIVYLRMLSFASDPLRPPVPNETALVLLSLSAITVGASAYVDASKGGGEQTDGAQKAAPNAAPASPISRGLISDVLNDSGTNLHRLQLVVWNLMLGIDYLYEGLTQHVVPTPMPTYGKEIYALLGISSATYVALKGGEDPKGSGSN